MICEVKALFQRSYVTKDNKRALVNEIFIHFITDSDRVLSMIFIMNTTYRIYPSSPLIYLIL